MQDSIQSKLEAPLNELLDLGMRNPLLNYRLTASKGIHIGEEKSVYIYDILVNQKRAMTFLSRKTQEQGEHVREEVHSDEDLEEAYSDSKLQTNDPDEVLQKRLVNTYYAANTSIEEQGVNILYLVLGMLKWYESDKSEEQRLAPLVLLLVGLERSSAMERFRLKYSLGLTQPSQLFANCVANLLSQQIFCGVKKLRSYLRKIWLMLNLYLNSWNPELSLKCSKR